MSNEKSEKNEFIHHIREITFSSEAFLDFFFELTTRNVVEFAFF